MPDPDDLAPAQVHLWHTAVPSHRADRAGLLRVLSGDERSRAVSFQSDEDADRFIVTRGCLRVLLGRYLHVDPDLVGLATEPLGKPYLSDSSHRWLQFNVAHSGALAVFAIAHSSPVGVDVERIPDRFDTAGFVARFLAPTEQSSFEQLPVEQHLLAAIRCWTRKEAVLKGLGCGLQVEPRWITAFPNSVVSVPRHRGVGKSPLEWQVREYATEPGYVAAVAVTHHTGARTAGFGGDVESALLALNDQRRG